MLSKSFLVFSSKYHNYMLNKSSLAYVNFLVIILSLELNHLFDLQNFIYIQLYYKLIYYN